jgi:chromosome segregation ATPase
MTPPHFTLSSTELKHFQSSIDYLCEAIEALEAAVQNTSVDNAGIKAHLQVVLQQLSGLASNVSGDRGLISRVSVLEAQCRALQDDIDAKNSEVREEVAREIDILRSSVSELRALQETHLTQDILDLKSAKKDSRNVSLTIIGLVISALAVCATLAFGMQNCQKVGVSRGAVDAPTMKEGK